MHRCRLLAVAALCLTVALPAPASAAIRISRVYVNSPGADTSSNSSLNGEYVVIRNTGSRARGLKGWTLRDESSHIYRFGDYRLGADSTVKVFTGKGSNTAHRRYWGQSWHVWNNSGGDSARLRTSGGSLVDKCSWGTVDSWVAC